MAISASTCMTHYLWEGVVDMAHEGNVVTCTYVLNRSENDDLDAVRR